MGGQHFDEEGLACAATTVNVEKYLSWSFSLKVAHESVVREPLLWVELITPSRAKNRHIVAYGVASDKVFPVAGWQFWISAYMPCPVIINIDIATAKQVKTFLGKGIVRQKRGEAHPVFVIIFFLHGQSLVLILLRLQSSLLWLAVMVITMTVVLPTVGEGLRVRTKSLAIKCQELVKVAMGVIQGQLDTAVIRPLLTFWISLIAREEN
jgi:hypothetical protein